MVRYNKNVIWTGARTMPRRRTKRLLIPLHAAGATPKQHHRFFFSALFNHLARSTEPTTTAPAP